jgi:hypothetical protein
MASAIGRRPNGRRDIVDNTPYRLNADGGNRITAAPGELQR